MDQLCTILKKSSDAMHLSSTTFSRCSMNECHFILHSIESNINNKIIIKKRQQLINDWIIVWCDATSILIEIRSLRTYFERVPFFSFLKNLSCYLYLVKWRQKTSFSINFGFDGNYSPHSVKQFHTACVMWMWCACSCSLFIEQIIAEWENRKKLERSPFWGNEWNTMTNIDWMQMKRDRMHLCCCWCCDWCHH